ncbi:hypothetical protein MASR2M78_21220 [Treponema sp.]
MKALHGACHHKRSAPDGRALSQATLINFSNPSGLVAEAVANQSSIRMMGLCNGPINMITDVRSRLGNNFKTFDYDFVGLNHLCWITAAYADGIDKLPKLLSGGTQAAALKNIDGIDYDARLLAAVPYLPIAYLNYFYFRRRELSMQTKAEQTCENLR